jgi:hypothetical protein
VIALKTTLFLICALLLLPVTAGSVEQVGKVSGEKHIYTVIEFESTFMNRKKEKVLKILGEPDLKWEHRGKEVWKFLRVIKDQDKIWDQNILFDFGRVNMMWGEASVEADNELSP